MKPKSYFPSLIVCLLVLFSAPASAWSLMDGVQQVLSDNARCERIFVSSDEGQASEGEAAAEEEEPDCE